MVVLVDNNKAVKISIREWDEENSQYGPDWSADFYDVGLLPQVPVLSDYTDADLAELGLPPRAVIQLDDVVEPSGRFIDGIGAEFRERRKHRKAPPSAMLRNTDISL